MVCELCQNFGTEISPNARIRKCLNSNCKTSYFYATFREMAGYYTKFLEKLLHKDEYKIPKKIYKSPEYRVAWENFIMDIFYNRSFEDIGKLSYLYLHGVGVKKSLLISNSLISYMCMIHSEGELKNPCPVCISNPTIYGELCSVCGNSICEYCYRKIKEKRCPCCRNPYDIDFDSKIINLMNLMERFRNTERSSIIKLDIVKILLKNKQNDTADHFATELVSRGYEPAIPSLSKIRNSMEIIELGAKRMEKNSLYILAHKYMSKGKIKKGLHYYSLALGRGDFNSFLFLDRR